VIQPVFLDSIQSEYSMTPKDHKAQGRPLSDAETQRRIKNLIALKYMERARDLPDGAIPADATTPADGWYSLPVPFYHQEVYYCRDGGRKVIWTALEEYQSRGVLFFSQRRRQCFLYCILTKNLMF
jgi:hypothetical protein